MRKLCVNNKKRISANSYLWAGFAVAIAVIAGLNVVADAAGGTTANPWQMDFFDPFTLQSLRGMDFSINRGGSVTGGSIQSTVSGAMEQPSVSLGSSSGVEGGQAIALGSLGRPTIRIPFRPVLRSPFRPPLL